MIDNGESSSLLNPAENEEEYDSAQMEQEEGSLEKNLTAVKFDIADAEVSVARPKNLAEWATCAYTMLHGCLDDPGGTPPRQPTEEDWANCGFTSQEVIQIAVQHLIDNHRIIAVDGVFSMPRVAEKEAELQKETSQNLEKVESDSSNLSTNKVRYPYSHVQRFLSLKDEKVRAPS